MVGYTVNGGLYGSGFDDAYCSMYESAPGMTDLDNVRPEVKAAFNGLAKAACEGTGGKLLITGGAETTCHAPGPYGHHGGWKLDVDPGSVNATCGAERFCDLCKQFGCAAGDEGNHYDLAFNSQGGVGGTVVATPDKYLSDGGGSNEGNGGGKSGGGVMGALGNAMSAINKAKGAANNTFGGGSGYVEINPKKKTYCEPVYPDLIYVQGNIPNTAVEDTVVNGMDHLEPAGDYGVVTSQGMQDLLGMDGTAFTTDKAQQLAQRQFDPSNCIQEVKVPNAGKPLNNNDPYPVDLKIEELEKHMPRIKQYKLPYNKQHLETKALAEAILKLSDFTEKRIVKLENILATVMRYTFGMGKRMHINCQYYGGQDHRSGERLAAA